MKKLQQKDQLPILKNTSFLAKVIFAVKTQEEQNLPCKTQKSKSCIQFVFACSVQA
jgi:hypothetical protein